jgi:hypothetical protein
MSVGEVNDEGLPLDTRVNTRLSRVCGLAARQRVSLILQEFVELTKMKRTNSSKTLFKHMFNIFHAWRSYKSKLVKIWRNQDTPFDTYKDLSEEDWERIVERCESENFVVNCEYMQWLRS